MNFDKKTVEDVSLSGKTVLASVDFNVPLGDDGEVKGDYRIRRTLPTIKYILDHGAKGVVLISHMGRPSGRDGSLSLHSVYKRLVELLPETPVSFVSEVFGPDVRQLTEELDRGVLLLENTRFWSGEENNDPEFARQILRSTQADIFVQDAFGRSMREHASTVGIVQYGTIPAVAGLLLKQEIESVRAVLESPRSPVLVIIGGAKIKDKAPAIAKLLPIADTLFVGGKIAAEGYTSDNDKVIVNDSFVRSAEEVMDIGGVGIGRLTELIDKAKTIVWAGTLGYVEDPEFAVGTKVIAQAIAAKKDATVVIGGGDTTAAVEKYFSGDDARLSTGGSAVLDLLSGKELPAVYVLDDK